jgi:hypothetical protein
MIIASKTLCFLRSSKEALGDPWLGREKHGKKELGSGQAVGGATICLKLSF